MSQDTKAPPDLNDPDTRIKHIEEINFIHLIPIGDPVGLWITMMFGKSGKIPRDAVLLEWLNSALPIDAPRIEHVEHVNVMFKGRHSHLFIDEEGFANERLQNVDATDIYNNATRHHYPHSDTPWMEVKQSYNVDFTIDLNPEYRKDRRPLIVGPAILCDGLFRYD